MRWRMPWRRRERSRPAEPHAWRSLPPLRPTLPPPAPVSAASAFAQDVRRRLLLLALPPPRRAEPAEPLRGTVLGLVRPVVARPAVEEPPPVGEPRRDVAGDHAAPPVEGPPPRRLPAVAPLAGSPPPLLTRVAEPLTETPPGVLVLAGPPAPATSPGEAPAPPPGGEPPVPDADPGAGDPAAGAAPARRRGNLGETRRRLGLGPPILTGGPGRREASEPARARSAPQRAAEGGAGPPSPRPAPAAGAAVAGAAVPRRMVPEPSLPELPVPEPPPPVPAPGRPAPVIAEAPPPPAPAPTTPPSAAAPAGTPARARPDPGAAPRPAVEAEADPAPAPRAAPEPRAEADAGAPDGVPEVDREPLPSPPAPPPAIEAVPTALREAMLRTHGADIGAVRVRRDDAAERLTVLHSARVVTRDREVFLPAHHGPLDRAPADGLLAHELVHVVQQRRIGPDLPAESSPEGRRLEHEARAAEVRWRRDASLPTVPAIAPTAAPPPQAPRWGGRAPRREPVAPPRPAGPVVPRVAEPAPAVSIPELQRAGDAPAPGTAEPSPPAAVEAVPEVAVDEPAPSGPPPAPIAPAPAPRLDELDLDLLSRRLYERLRSQLRTELLVDRERSGLLSDLSR